MVFYRCFERSLLLSHQTARETILLLVSQHLHNCIPLAPALLINHRLLELDL